MTSSERITVTLPGRGKGGLMDNRSTQIGGGDGGNRQDAAEKTTRETPEKIGNTDVLGILDGIESQFDRLRTIRHEHVDALRTLTERSQKLQEDEKAAQELHDQLAADQQEWTGLRQKQKREIEEIRTCLEADRSAHVRRVEEDKQTLERDRSTLESDQQRIRGELDDLKRRHDTRSLELEEQSRKLTGKEQELDEKSLEIEQKEREFRSRETAVEQAQQEFINALKAAHFTIARRGHQISRLESTAVRLRHVRNQLRRRSHALASANRFHLKQLADLNGRIEEQDSRLEEAGRRMRSFMIHLREQADLVQQGHASLALADELKSRVQDLEFDNIRLKQELDQAREELDNSDCGRQDVDNRNDASIERQRQELACIARHLHSRRGRLKRIKRALQQRPIGPTDSVDAPELIEQRMRQSEIIEQRQRELDDVRCMLASSEKKMIKRWAGPRAIVIAGWSVVMMAIIAVASWFAADHLRPPVKVASVSLAPQVMNGQSFDSQAATAWVAMHEKQLQSERFIREIARRAAARHLAPWDSYAAVHELITSRLALDDAVPGTLMLTLPSDDAERAARFLDILATSMATDAQRSISSRPGGHASRVIEVREENGVTRHAALESGVLQDDRLVTASVIFGGASLACFMFVAIIYSRLLRSKRIFEETHSTAPSVPVMQARPI
ncbi:MAG: hypothetical protein CMJ39_12340 [Phycisphaerae bacterium]|nr:hypothetical protein [Phycisphaerae bacterium]